MRRLLIILICTVVVSWMPHSAAAFGVSPGTQEVEAERGKATETSVTIINDTSDEQVYFLESLAFEPREDQPGAPRFLPDEKEGLASWIAFPSKKVSVAARSSAELPLIIAVPGDARPGGHYAAVVVSTTPSDVVASNGATVEAKTAALLFVTVPGEMNERLALMSFESSRSGDVLASSACFSATIRLQNQGNVHVVPQGRVVVRDLLNREIVSYPVNETGARVLPSSSRAFELGPQAPEEVELGESFRRQIDKFPIGPMRAELELTYGDGKTVSADPIRFWIIPGHLLGLLALIASMLVAAAWLWRRSARRPAPRR